jgi:hypothetical protein
VTNADRTVSTQVPSSFVEELDEECKLESAQIAGPDPNALVDHVPVDIPDVMQNILGRLSMNVESTASLEGDGSSIRAEYVQGNGVWREIQIGGSNFFAQKRKITSRNNAPQPKGNKVSTKSGQ